MVSVIWAHPLVVINGDFLVDAILNKGIHNRSVYLTEKPPCVMDVFGNDYETVIVKHIAVQLVACTSFVAGHSSSTLKAVKINGNARSEQRMSTYSRRYVN